jgi:hypothetical protein
MRLPGAFAGQNVGRLLTEQPIKFGTVGFEKAAGKIIYVENVWF